MGTSPFPERNRRMVALYEHGLTLQDIGDLYGMTRERVRQITTREGVDTAAIMQQRSERMITYVGSRAHASRKLTMDKAREIRERHTDGESGRSLARAFGVNGGAVWQIVNNKTYKERKDEAQN